MKTTKRIFSILLTLILLLLAGGIMYLNHIKTRAIPDYNEDVDLEGLTEHVTVYRDSMGIPHIYAKNELDLYRTVGYVMAQDRLWQMDLMRRITLGRLSEVLDPELVDTDQLFRALRLSKKSEMSIQHTDPKVLDCLEAYADGVNQYIEKQGNRLPFEFAMLGYEPEPWTLEHTFNLIGYMHWTLATGWTEEMALFRLQQLIDSTLYHELLPEMDLQTSHVYPEFMTSDPSLQIQSHLGEAIQLIEELGLELFRGSNNWAVSGARSKTGKPLLSNDMHLGLAAPGIFYQMHHVVEGSLNVTGITFPCSPFIVAGHNEDIAWGFTNVMVDETDFYLETINPEDSNQYLLDGEWMDMELVRETIPFKGSDESAIRVNRFTHRGPVVSSFKGVNDRVISMRWQGNEFSNEQGAIYSLNRAGNWDEFREAVSTFYVGQNCVYADRFGNIGLQMVAGVPIRKGGGIMVYPGDTSLYDWTGQVPFEELPFSFNPECGYVSSANNRTVGDDYPYYIGTWFGGPSRIERIREMLEAQPKHGMEDFRTMQKDQCSHLAMKFTPVYLEALEGTLDGIYKEAHKELNSWDFKLDAGSSAAMIYEIMWIELQKALFTDELGDQVDILIHGGSLTSNLLEKIRVTGGSAWCDDVTTPGIVEQFDDNIRIAFTSTVDAIADMFGKDPGSWKWGDLHKLALMHPMGRVSIVDKLFRVNRGPYPIGGSFHTVCPYSYPAGSSFAANHGAAQRHIFDPSDWDRSLTVIPTGNSGIPASPHYMDQTELYVANRLHMDHFSRSAVEANSLYKAIFE